MNSIKAKFSLLSVLLMTMFVLPSCSDDDDNESTPNPIVGTWEYQKQGAAINVTYTYVFSSNMRYTWSYLSTVGEEGTYTINGNKVHLTPDNEYYVESELTLNGNRLYDPELDIYYTKK